MCVTLVAVKYSGLAELHAGQEIKWQANSLGSYSLSPPLVEPKWKVPRRWILKVA